MRQSIIIALTFFQLILARLDANSDSCKIFLSKFENQNFDNGNGLTQLGFTGNILLIPGTSNLQITLQYSDINYFSNDTFYGLVQEDGHTAEETCLDLKLYKYDSIHFSNEIEVIDLDIEPSHYYYKKQRFYTFIIQQQDFNTRLIQTQNSDQYIYTGFYSIKYYLAGTNQLQFSFYFQFSLTINKLLGYSIETMFHPLNYFETLSCQIQSTCLTSPLTKISFCSDITCNKIINNLNLFLYDTITLKQEIIQPELKDYYLTSPTAYFIGDELSTEAKINYYNSQRGYSIYQINIYILWPILSIQVNAYLSIEQNQETFLNKQNQIAQFDPVSGTTEALECVNTYSNYNSCATCEEQCNNQGYSSSSCPSCSNSNTNDNSSPIVTILLSIVFTIYFMAMVVIWLKYGLRAVLAILCCFCLCGVK